jgi:hypothetical protein
LKVIIRQNGPNSDMNWAASSVYNCCAERERERERESPQLVLEIQGLFCCSTARGRRAHDDGLLLLVPARDPPQKTGFRAEKKHGAAAAVAAELHGASELLFLCTKLL